MTAATYHLETGLALGVRVVIAVAILAVLVVAVRAAARTGTAGKITVLVLVIAALVVGYKGVADHHIGAMPDPYPSAGSNCPAGSHYVSHWYHSTWPPNAGVERYLGWTEVASCGATLQVGVS